MARKLVIAWLVGALAVATVGAFAAPPAPPAARRQAEAVPLVKALADTLEEIAQGIGALHRALPMIAPRLEPIQEVLKGLREAAKEPAKIEVEAVLVDLIKLDLLLHRLLFDLEQGARRVAEFRDRVGRFVERCTERMDRRMAHRVRMFARELLECIRERGEERGPRAARPKEVARIVEKLERDVNRLDLLLLRALEAAEAKK